MRGSMFGFFSSRRNRIIDSYLLAMIRSGKQEIDVPELYFEAACRYALDNGGKLYDDMRDSIIFDKVFHGENYSIFFHIGRRGKGTNITINKQPSAYDIVHEDILATVERGKQAIAQGRAKNRTNQADADPRSSSALAEATRAEATRAEAARVEAARVEAARAEAARAEAARAEAARAEAARVEAARVEAARVEAARAEAARVEAARVEAARVEAGRAEAARAEAARVEAARVEAGRAEAARAEAARAEAARAEAARVEAARREQRQIHAEHPASAPTQSASVFRHHVLESLRSRKVTKFELAAAQEFLSFFAERATPVPPKIEEHDARLICFGFFDLNGTGIILTLAVLVGNEATIYVAGTLPVPQGELPTSFLRANAQELSAFLEDRFSEFRDSVVVHIVDRKG
ncbi:hypothetical protein [Teichococcus deserti]|uniref:hypothetical protein n=1 Tax=Teichococcus deserti TaxID=1817963 RepID=UPI0013F66570|nr:hypothetical protein [Pseudoroseomonas deserti]